ncbi:ATP-binding protein [Methanogenium organophilum]|uniref:Protein CR006 P-loop domain-containing protein n=1 Tax=Methanogenium organophilum TaxID=2199 RepID=A0A9X9T8V8_METOG|nr:hypothetical protein [Methanogenium organophilum]WAI01557.1 hypothetical protein OU421_01405 [Methanogenium organophilum]
MQKRVSINLENCYGIKQFDFEFCFEQNSSIKKKSVFGIYASNGAMKSSFAKTFTDYQNSGDSKDLRYPSRKTIREINDENGNPLVNDQIYVIHPFLESFESDKVSLLLATKSLKERYEKIHKDLNEKKDEFIREIKKSSKIRDNIANENFILNDFKEQDLYVCLENMHSEIKNLKISDISKIKYKDIFNPDVEKFLLDEDNKKLLEEYIERFDELLEEADYFVKDIFTHNNASDVSKYLKNSGFYKANHKVLLESEKGTQIVNSDENFLNIIDTEKKRIFGDESLIEKFEKIDNAITAKENLKKFRTFLEKNKFIIPDLVDIDGLKKKFWLNYIKIEEDRYNELIFLYRSGKDEIKGIIEEAKKEFTLWEEVKDKFNSRFKVPFIVKIENKEDVILGSDTPTIKFEFKDSNEEYIADRENAMKVLSQGEKKALYLLDIIYEIEVRRKNNQETIFIFDDIADSFDYMNKYAIVEYMIDISKDDFFYQIILTHNFDFFRTLNSRFIPDDNCYIAEKNDSGIKLQKASFVKMPLREWIKNASKNENYVIALIPFIRNVIEYTKGTDEQNYLSLTSMLHLKNDTLLLTNKDLEFILAHELPNAGIKIVNPTNRIFDTIKSCSNKCLASNCNNLEEKIVLSIGIRLEAEYYMYNKMKPVITDIDTKIQKWTTGTMVGKYKKEFPSERNTINILDRVNLMTPENIHLNSFMYEPLIDLSGDHLCKLYRDVSHLDQ